MGIKPQNFFQNQNTFYSMSNSQLPHTFLPQAFFGGKFIPFVDAKISVATHAFQYGTGAFGGLRGSVDSTTGRTKLFRLDRHADRLSRSAKYFGYDIEPEFIRSKNSSKN